MQKVINSFSSPTSPQARGSITLLKDLQPSQHPGITVLGTNFNSQEFNHLNQVKNKLKAQLSNGSIVKSHSFHDPHKLYVQSNSMNSRSQQDHRVSFPGNSYQSNSIVLFQDNNNKYDLSQYNIYQSQIQPQIPIVRNRFQNFLQPNHSKSVIIQNNQSQQTLDKVRSLSSHTRNNLSANSIGNNSTILYINNNADINRNNSIKFSTNNNSGVSNGLLSTYHTTNKKVDPINDTILKHEKKLKQVLETKNIINARDSNLNLYQSYGGNIYLSSQQESQTYQRIYLVNNIIQVSPKKKVFKTIVQSIQKQPENKIHITPLGIYSKNQSPARLSVERSSYNNNYQIIKKINQAENSNSNYNLGSPNSTIRQANFNSGSPYVFNSPTNNKFMELQDNEMKKSQGIQINSPSSQIYSYQIPQQQVKQSQQFLQSQQLPQPQYIIQSQSPNQSNLYQKPQQLLLSQQQPQQIIIKQEKEQCQQTQALNQQNQNNISSSPTLTFAQSNNSSSRKPSVETKSVNPQQQANSQEISIRITQLLEKYQQRAISPKINSSQNSFNIQEKQTKDEKSEQNSQSQINNLKLIQANTQNPQVNNQIFTFTKPIDIPQVQEAQTSQSIPEYSPINNLYDKSLDKNSFSQQKSTPNNLTSQNTKMNKTPPTLNTKQIQNSCLLSPTIKSPFIQSPVIKSPVIQSSTIQNSVIQNSHQQNYTQQSQSFKGPAIQQPHSQLSQTNSNQKQADQIKHTQQLKSVDSQSNSKIYKQNPQNSSQKISQLTTENQKSPTQNNSHLNHIVSQIRKSIPPYTPLLYPAYNGVENPLKYIRQYSQNSLTRNTSQENIRHFSHSPVKGTNQLDQGKPIFLSQAPSFTRLLSPPVQQPFQTKISLPIISNIITSSPQGLKSQKIQVRQTTQTPLEGGLQLNTQVTTEHEVKDMNNNPVAVQHIFLNNIFGNSSDKKNKIEFNQPYLNLSTQQKMVLQLDSEGDQYQEIINQISYQKLQDASRQAISLNSNQKSLELYNLGQSPSRQICFTDEHNLLGSNKKYETYQANNMFISDPVKQKLEFESQKKKNDVDDQKERKRVFSFSKEQNTGNNPIKTKQLEENVDRIIGNIFQEALNKVNENINIKRSELDSQMNLMNEQRQILEESTQKQKEQKSILNDRLSFQQYNQSKLQSEKQNINNQHLQYNEQQKHKDQYYDINKQANQYQNQSLSPILRNEQVSNDKYSIQRENPQLQKNFNSVDEFDKNQFEIFKKIENGNHFHVPMTEEQKKELANNWQKPDSLQQLMMDQLNENKKKAKGVGSKSSLGNSVSSISRFNGKSSIQSINQIKNSQDSFCKNSNQKSSNPPSNIQSLNMQSQQPQQQQKTYSFFQNSQSVASNQKIPSNAYYNPLTRQSTSLNKKEIVKRMENQQEEPYASEDKSQFSFQQMNSLLHSDEKKINNYKSNSAFQNPSPSVQQQAEDDKNFVIQQHIKIDIMQPQYQHQQYEQQQILKSVPESQPINPSSPKFDNIQLESPLYESEKDRKYREFLIKMLNNHPQKRGEILKKIDKLNKKLIEGIYQSSIRQSQSALQGMGQSSSQNPEYQQQNHNGIILLDQKSYDIDEMRKNKHAQSNIPSHIVYESNKKQSKKKFDMNQYMTNTVSESEMKNQIQQLDILRQNDHESPVRRSPNKSQNSNSKSPNLNKKNNKQNQNEDNPFFNESQIYGRKLRPCEIQAILEGRQKSSSPKKINYINTTNQSKIYNEVQRKQQQNPSPNSLKLSSTPSQKNSQLISSNISKAEYKKSTPKNIEQIKKTSKSPQNQQNNNIQNKTFEQIPNQNSHMSNAKQPIKQIKENQFSKSNTQIKQQEKTNKQKGQPENVKFGMKQQKLNNKTLNVKQSQAQQQNKHIHNGNNRRNQEQTNKYHISPQKIKEQDIYIEQGQGNYSIYEPSQEELYLTQNSENIIPTSYKQNVNYFNNKKQKQQQQYQPQRVEQHQNYNIADQQNNQISKNNIPQQNIVQQNQIMNSQKPLGNSYSQYEYQFDNIQDIFQNQNQQIPQNNFAQQPYIDEQIHSLKYQTTNNNKISSSPRNIIQNINDMKKYSEYMFANNQNLLKELDQKPLNNSFKQDRSSSRNKPRNNSNSQGRPIIQDVGQFFQQNQEQQRFPVSRSNNSSLIRGNKKFIEDGDDNSSRNGSNSQRFSVNNQDQQQIQYNPNQNKLFVQIRKNIN